MKHFSKLFAVAIFTCFCFGSCADEEPEKRVLNRTRNACIELNREYNRLYQIAMKQYVSGNQEFGTAASCLQEIFDEVMKMNKELGIDCKQYDSDGSVIYGKDQSGQDVHVETLPNELRISE